MYKSSTLSTLPLVIPEYIWIVRLFLKETYRCAFFVVAAKLDPNESFTKCVKLPYRHIAHSWHNLHHKASTSILFPTNFPLFLWHDSLFFLWLRWHIGIITQGMYMIRFPTHLHLFLDDLTHTGILDKSVYKERCRRFKCFYYCIFFYQNRNY